MKNTITEIYNDQEKDFDQQIILDSCKTVIDNQYSDYNFQGIEQQKLENLIASLFESKYYCFKCNEEVYLQDKSLCNHKSYCFGDIIEKPNDSNSIEFIKRNKYFDLIYFWIRFIKRDSLNHIDDVDLSKIYQLKNILGPSLEYTIIREQIDIMFLNEKFSNQDQKQFINIIPKQFKQITNIINKKEIQSLRERVKSSNFNYIYDNSYTEEELKILILSNYSNADESLKYIFSQQMNNISQNILIIDLLKNYLKIFEIVKKENIFNHLEFDKWQVLINFHILVLDQNLENKNIFNEQLNQTNKAILYDHLEQINSQLCNNLFDNYLSNNISKISQDLQNIDIGNHISIFIMQNEIIEQFSRQSKLNRVNLDSISIKISKILNYTYDKMQSVLIQMSVVIVYLLMRHQKILNEFACFYIQGLEKEPVNGLIKVHNNFKNTYSSNKKIFEEFMKNQISYPIDQKNIQRSLNISKLKSPLKVPIMIVEYMLMLGIYPIQYFKFLQGYQQNNLLKAQQWLANSRIDKLYELLYYAQFVNSTNENNLSQQIDIINFYKNLIKCHDMLLLDIVFEIDYDFELYENIDVIGFDSINDFFMGINKPTNEQIEEIKKNNDNKKFSSNIILQIKY